jgi:hypothetical protein
MGQQHEHHKPNPNAKTITTNTNTKIQNAHQHGNTTARSATNHFRVLKALSLELGESLTKTGHVGDLLLADERIFHGLLTRTERSTALTHVAVTHAGHAGAVERWAGS